MTPQDDETLWRNRFIAINLVRIGGTIVVLLGLASGRATCSSRAARSLGLADHPGRPRRQLLGAEMARAPLADPARAMKRFYKQATVSPEAGGIAILLDGRPVRTPARAPLRAADRGAGRGDRRRMERAGREDRPARHAAHRPRQCRDRPGRARPGRLRAGRSPIMARATCSATAPRARDRWSRARPELWDPLLAWARHRFDVEFETDRRDHAPAAAARDGRAARPGGGGARRRSSSPGCRRWSPSPAR